MLFVALAAAHEAPQHAQHTAHQPPQLLHAFGQLHGRTVQPKLRFRHVAVHCLQFVDPVFTVGMGNQDVRFHSRSFFFVLNKKRE
jgi:hypothetical protein